MFLHIDGDLIVYRAGFAAEKGAYTLIHNETGDMAQLPYKKDVDKFIEGNEEAWTVSFERIPEPVKNAFWAVKMILRGIFNRFPECTGHCIYLSGDENFREDIAVTRPYKGNRDPNAKPVHAGAIKLYLEKHNPVVYSVSEEADDVIGWSHMKMYEDDPLSSCIVSCDKDMRMIPGLHYDFVKEECFSVDEDTADYNFWKQMLTGDSTDNIPGVPGIGDKKATDWLADANDLPKAVKQLYKDGYKADWRSRMLEMGQLLWIRRHEDEMWVLPKELEE